MIPLYLKRCNKEINNFKEKKYYNKYKKNIVNFFDQLDIEKYLIDDELKDEYINISKKNNTLIELKIPKSYPFKNYNIIYNNIINNSKNNSINNSYFKTLASINKNKLYDDKVMKFFYIILYQIEPIFLNLKTNDCYCCNSLNCYYNWNPSLTFENIILEYLELEFIFKYNKPYNYLYLLNIYNNLFQEYFNKLPDDIINIIILYIKK